MTRQSTLIKSFFFLIGLILLVTCTQSVTKIINLHLVDTAYARGTGDGCGGGGGDGGHDGGESGSGGSGDTGSGGNGSSGGESGVSGDTGGGSGDGGHGGGSASGVDGGDMGDGGHGDDDLSHNMPNASDHDHDVHSHSVEESQATLDSTDHIEDHIDHHDDESHHTDLQPPVIADEQETTKTSEGDGELFEPGIILAINVEQSDKEAAWAMGLAVEQQVVLSNLDIVITRFRLPTGAKTRKSLQILLKQKHTGHYDLNHYYRTAGTSPESDIRSYPRRLIGWSDQFQLHDTPPARIGMVDTYVNTDIAALNGQKIITRSFTTRKKKSAVTHGTGIAALIVGAADSNFPGLIPWAKLYAANAFSIDKSGRQHASVLAVAQALNWLIAQHVDIINLSLTGPDNRLLRLAVERILSRPIPIVAAAGNQGPGAPPVYPAAYKNVIAVTAVDRFNRIYRHANQGPYIRFAAPGVRIWVPDKAGRGNYRHGTSYAAALGTAVVNRYWSRPEMVKKITVLIRLLRKNAIDLGPPGKDPRFGWGLIHYMTPPE